jgi:hypothetical protein
VEGIDTTVTGNIKVGIIINFINERFLFLKLRNALECLENFTQRRKGKNTQSAQRDGE